MEAPSLSGDPRNIPALISSIPFINTRVLERVPQELKDSRKFDPSKSNAIQVTMVTAIQATGDIISYLSVQLQVIQMEEKTDLRSANNLGGRSA